MNQEFYDVWAVREQFPILSQNMSGKPLVYLDSGATTQKPKQVIEGISEFYAKHYATVHRAVYELAAQSTDQYSEVREQVKTFINAKDEREIIYTKGTTEAINLVARSFGGAYLQEGDEVLISEMEHHSNIVPWQMITQEKGAILKAIPIINNGELDLKAFQSLLTDKTKLVAIAHVSNATGTVNPIRDIIRMAHKKGAKVLIDGAQAASHFSVDVQELDADFYAFSSHKMYGPTGIGILYGKLALLNQMPPYQGGGDMVEHVTIKRTLYQPPPLRFEAGTPMIASVIGLGKAIGFIQELGRGEIAKWETHLTNYALYKMQNISGIQILGHEKHRSSIISFVIDQIHPLDLGTILGLKGIAIRTGNLCAQPTLQHFGLSSVCRISFGVYNTVEEIDYFITSLNEAIAILSPSYS